MRCTRIGPSWAFLAFVISFSAIGRSALALASVVVMPSAANSDAARLAIIRRWCWDEPPKLRERRGVAGMSVFLQHRSLQDLFGQRLFGSSLSHAATGRARRASP